MQLLFLQTEGEGLTQTTKTNLKLWKCHQNIVIWVEINPLNFQQTFQQNALCPTFPYNHPRHQNLSSKIEFIYASVLWT